MADYFAASSSLDTHVPAPCDTIDRLSGCLELVVANVTNGAFQSQSFSSRHHVVLKTEKSTLNPQCGLRTVPVYSFSIFFLCLHMAVVPHADPVPPMCETSVASQISRLPLGPRQCFLEVPGAAQSVAVPSMVSPITAVSHSVPPLPFSVFQMPAHTAPTQPLQALPTGQSPIYRSDTIGGAAPATGSDSS